MNCPLFLALVVLLACSLLSVSAQMSEAEVRRTIREHLDASFPAASASSLCSQHTCCNVTSSQSCPIDAFKRDESALVFPGGKTRCIFSYSTPFAFQVIPGDTDKLLFYFQGGGACWDALSTVAAPLCSTDVSPQSAVGVFDRSNIENRFRAHTIVHVLYCSGDVHGGQVVRDYSDKQGVPVSQQGLANARAALDWTKQQISSGRLSSVLSDLVVMGCSAGSLGTQLWAKEVLQSLPWRTAAVVPDSYAGVFPPGTVGPLMYAYGFCESGLLSPALYNKCVKQQLSLEEMNQEFMRAQSTVPFAFIQSKTDIVQQSFYVSVAISMNSSSKTITPAQFYSGVNDIFGGYNANASNFVTYLVNGDQHCFTNQALYFTADPQSAKDNGKSTASVMMHDWANTLPLRDGESVNTVCDGSVKNVLTGEKEKVTADNTYCSAQVVPKTFVEKY